MKKINRFYNQYPLLTIVLVSLVVSVTVVLTLTPILEFLFPIN